MQKKQNTQSGEVVVEATVILPIAILAMFLLLYLSLLIAQKANLQASLETALVYYKNTVTDTYISAGGEMNYAREGNNITGIGNIYSADGTLDPYRGLFGNASVVPSQADFIKYFRSITGNMVFEDNLDITFKYKNYVLIQQFEAAASQKITLPIDFSILGLSNEYEIRVAAKVVVSNHDDMVRDVDFAIDILEDTKLGEFAKEIGANIGKAYEKIEGILN